MFKLTVVISAFLLVACVGAAPRIRHPGQNGRIMGGAIGNISEVPYLLSLEYDGYFVCGAAIIDELFAVTAAQCVDGLSKDLISVRAGSSLRESGGSVHRAEEIYVHPFFDFNAIDYDVAVIAVSQPFQYGENVQPIPVAMSEPAPGSMALVSGWGAIDSGDFPSQLHKVEVPIVDHDKCKEVYSFFLNVTDNMICAGVEEGGKDSCMGDAGGPLVVGGELVGIVSWGYDCGVPGFPGVYTNLPALSQQFRKVIRHHNIVPKLFK